MYPETFDLRKYVRHGRNVLAVRATNTPSIQSTDPAGLIGRLEIRTGDGRVQTYRIVGEDEAVKNALLLVKEGGAEAVKLEGGHKRVQLVKRLVDEEISVMGHIGLTPQSATMLGGYKAQGRTASKARQLFADAQALQAAGCFAIVLEAVPPAVARTATRALSVPTIGIGAGPDTDGQVLVWHDMLGYYEGRAPRFVKRYADLGAVITEALERFADDVRNGAFPEQRHTYAMPDEEAAAFEETLRSVSP